MPHLLGRIAGFFGQALGLRGAARPRPRPRPTRRPPAGFESLERREVMAAGAFLSATGYVAKSGADTVEFVLQPADLQAPWGRGLLVGFRAAADSGEADSPQVRRVSGPDGLKMSLFNTPGAVHIARILPPRVLPETYQVEVVETGDSAGRFVMDAFLAGDVDNDLDVDRDDLAAMRAAFGAREGSSGFDEAADVNGDGVVGGLDRLVLQANFGASANRLASPPPTVAAREALAAELAAEEAARIAARLASEALKAAQLAAEAAAARAAVAATAVVAPDVVIAPNPVTIPSPTPTVITTPQPVAVSTPGAGLPIGGVVWVPLQLVPFNPTIATSTPIAATPITTGVTTPSFMVPTTWVR